MSFNTNHGISIDVRENVRRLKLSKFCVESEFSSIDFTTMRVLGSEIFRPSTVGFQIKRKICQ